MSNYNYSYSKCSHFRFPLKVDADTTLYLSSSRDYWKADNDWEKNPIDVGVYLDATWKKDLTTYTPDVYTSPTTPKALRPTPALLKVWEGPKLEPLSGTYFPWADRGVPTLPKLKALVNWINGLLDNGHRVEVACIGGHGRTGTLAAAITLTRNLGKVTPAEAIKYIRQGYCHEAIESHVQEAILYELVGLTAPPPPPVKKWEASKQQTPAVTAKLYGDSLTQGEKAALKVWFHTTPLERLALRWDVNEMRKEELVQTSYQQDFEFIGE